MVPCGPRMLLGDCLVIIWPKKYVLKSLGKGVFAPWHLLGWVLGVLFFIIVRNWTPSGARLGRKVLWDDDVAPFSSDKIRAKILDLGYGGAHRTLHNLSPKSARI